MSKITFIISADGESVKIDDVCGAPGKACLDVSRQYENILGEVRESTREFTEDLDDQDLTIHQQNG